MVSYYDNLKNVYDNSTNDQKNRGIAWYGDSNIIAKNMAEEFDKDTKIIAAMIAVLSVGVRWERNVLDTYNLCVALSTDSKVTAVGVTTYKRQVNKALSIWELNNPEHNENLIGKGEKTLNFYRAICDPEGEHVVVDRWIARAAGYEKAHFPEGKDYRGISESVLLIAKQVKEMFVPAVQATIWLTIRDTWKEVSNIGF